MGFGPTRQTAVSRNQPRPAFVGEVRPCPLNHHQNPVFESDEEEDVNKQPCQPREISRDMYLAELRYSGGTSNGCKAAFVEIVEGNSLPALEIAANILCNRYPFLHRHRRYSRQ